jgi:hypothetical protein
MRKKEGRRVIKKKRRQEKVEVTQNENYNNNNDRIAKERRMRIRGNKEV